MATSLIGQFETHFAPERYEDTYRAALMKVIKAKQKGKTITAVPAAEDEEPADLLAALKASVDCREAQPGLGTSEAEADAPEAGRAQEDREALDRHSEPAALRGEPERVHHCLRLPFNGGVLVMWKARQRPQR